MALTRNCPIFSCCLSLRGGGNICFVLFTVNYSGHGGRSQMRVLLTLGLRSKENTDGERDSTFSLFFSLVLLVCPDNKPPLLQGSERDERSKYDGGGVCIFGCIFINKKYE